MTELLEDKIDDIIIDNNEEKNNCSWDVEGTKILNSNKKFLTDEELTTIRYCFKNPLPDNLRKEYWLLVIKAKEAELNNSDHYYNLLNKFPKSQKEDQILSDINRIFPEDPLEKKKV